MLGLIPRAIKILKEGGLVAYPTDTVYGLGADAFNQRAVLRIFEVKHRPKNQPLPILVADLNQLREVVKELPPSALSLAQHFLPGGLTLVLYKAPHVSPLITAESNKIAVRIPNHPIPLALIKGLGSPIIGTSANLSGQPHPLTSQEVEKQLGGKVDLIIPGECPGKTVSTIIDLTEGKPRLIRQGIIPVGEIERVLEGK